MRRFVILSPFAGVFLAAAIPFAAAVLAAAAPKLPSACTPGKAPSARVASVVDGATLVLDDGRVLTLAGIEAPLPPLAAPDGPSAIAAAATVGLAARTSGGGASVKVAIIGDKPDRYGRWRANVFTADGRW